MKGTALFIGAVCGGGAAGIGFFAAGCHGPNKPLPVPSQTQATPLLRERERAAISPSPSGSPFASTDAEIWWKRTLDASPTVPVRASVAVTRFHGGSTPPTISRYEMVEALGGRKYRITYHAPASAAGRIVLCDGQMLWQYEPNHDTVLRRPVPPSVDGFPSGDSTAKNRREAQKDPALRDTTNRVRLEADADSVAGRPTRILSLLATPGGPVVERRWVDIQTGRALRTERYDAHNKPWRRVEMTQVAFYPTIAEGMFVPAIAEGVRVVHTDHKTPLLPPPSSETVVLAQHLGLPLKARAFALKETVTPTLPPETAARVNQSAQTTHLIYSDGVAALSLFVTPVGDTPAGANGGSGAANAAGDDLAMTGTAGWKSIVLQTGDSTHAVPRQAWLQETPLSRGRERAAIAWTQNHNRLVAVAQMPSRNLQKFVETIAAYPPPQKVVPTFLLPDK